jgi:hypothetical protein
MEPKPKLKTLADVARFMRENFPEARDFPDREQPVAYSPLTSLIHSSSTYDSSTTHRPSTRSRKNPK